MYLYYSEEIRTTKEHPFYVEGVGFVMAGSLKEGDVLRLADGRTVEVSGIETEQLSEPVYVYNLEAEDYHTYFVSELGVLVHNNCGPGTGGKKPTSQNQMQNQVNKGQAPKGVVRVDSADPNIPGSQPHIHFGENEAALNFDGTWHDAGKSHPSITNKIKKWILDNGWNLPTE